MACSIEQTGFGSSVTTNWSRSIQGLWQKSVAITIAVLLHMLIATLLWIQPDQRPPIPVAIQGFQFVKLPETTMDHSPSQEKPREMVTPAQQAPEPSQRKPVPQEVESATPETAETSSLDATPPELPTPLLTTPAIDPAQISHPVPQPAPRRKHKKEWRIKKQVVKKQTIKKQIKRKKVASIQPKKSHHNLSQPSSSSTGQKKHAGQPKTTSVLKSQRFVPPKGRANLFNNTRPSYPIVARRRGFEGTVFLIVDVDKSGTPLSVKVKKSSGHRILDRSALRTIKRWRFIPAIRNGITVRALVEIPIRFNLLNR
ncbi:TonB family protein [Magnetococcales bacterium HHB-1]